MMPFNPIDCDVEYHPDDTPDFFLPQEIEDRILRILAQEAKTEKDKNTLNFIHLHEESQRKVSTSEMDRKTQKKIIEKLANDFCEKNGDWVHVVNPLYDKFYKTVLNKDLYK